MNLRDCVWETHVLNYHEDHIAGNGDNSLQHYNLVHKFIPMLSGYENSCSKSSSGQGMGKNWRKFRRGTWPKSKVRNKWSMKQGRRAQKFIFASLMDICHLKMAELEANHQKYKGRVVLRGGIVKDDSGSYAVFTEQGFISISNGYHFQIARLRWTSSGRSICLYTSENGRCSQIIFFLKKIPNRNVQTFGFIYHDINGLNQGPVWKIQSFLLSGICTVILLAGLSWERQVEKILLQHDWEKVSNWECLFMHRQKGLFLSIYVDDKIGWKETKHYSDVETTKQKSRFGRTHIFP